MMTRLVGKNEIDIWDLQGPQYKLQQDEWSLLFSILKIVTTLSEFNLEKEILFLALSLEAGKGELVRGKEDPRFGCCFWVNIFGILAK